MKIFLVLYGTFRRMLKQHVKCHDYPNLLIFTRLIVLTVISILIWRYITSQSIKKGEKAEDKICPCAEVKYDAIKTYPLVN